MAISFTDKSGAVSRRNTEDYICDRFLDLIEGKPFHAIKVKELVEYAGISRSTFYLYFDSIYAVAQKLEDEFLEGFYPERIASSVIVQGDASGALSQWEYLKEHSRVVVLLGGPNGDPYFLARLERSIRKTCHDVLKNLDAAHSHSEQELLIAYIVGGTLNLTKHLAEVGDDFDSDDMRELCATVIAANKTLLGYAEMR